MSKPSWFLLFCLFILGLSSLLPRTPSPQVLDFYFSPQEVSVTGIIVEDPDIREKVTQYTIAPQSILLNHEGQERQLQQSSRLLLRTQKYPELEKGDQLRITGILEKPETFGTFDYPGYLSRFGIYANMDFPRIMLMEPSRQSSSLLDTLRQAFESHLFSVYSSEPTTSLLSGLLIGQKRNLPEKTEDNFQRAGLSHILVISGFNITLLVGILMAVLKPFGKRSSIIGAAGAILFFTLFVGASPSVVRAAIMGGLSLLALTLNRKHESFLALLLAATAMAFYNPKILLFDIGFQLSFLATFGLIFVSPVLNRHLLWLPEGFAIRESMGMTLSAQLMTLPIIMMNFEQVSLIAPLSNLLIAGPIIPLTMILGFLGISGGMISIPIGKILGFPAYLLTQYLDTVAALTASIPFSTFDTPTIGKPILLLPLLLMGILIIRHSIQEEFFQIRISRISMRVEQKIFQTLYRK